MTLRDSMLTLGRSMDNPQPEDMRRMLERLAGLKDEYEAAEEFGWGEGILGQIRSDIFWQKQAIKRAVRINPGLAEMVVDAI